MSYRIAITDDNPVDIKYISSVLERWADARRLSVRTGSDTLLSAPGGSINQKPDVYIQTFPSAEAFLFQYEENPAWDIILLDIELSGMDGVTMAKRLREKNSAAVIVFITGYSDYIAEGYDVSALHYLMKPVDPDRFMEVMDRAVERLHREERLLTVKTADGLVRIPMGSVLFLEAARNYVTVHTEGRGDFVVRHKLGDFESGLDRRFLRVGRSYIVNLTKLYRITRSELVFPDGTVLPLPRGAYETLNRAIIDRL